MHVKPKLHAYLAHLGVASRRKAEELIAQGQVAVNGKPATVGQRVDPVSDQVLVKGKPISHLATTATATNDQLLQRLYFLVYKPVGYVSTTADELGRQTVLDLVPPSKIPSLTRLYPVGRLDLDSEGLLLVTNDGTLTNTLTHPSFEIQKTYQVLVEGVPSSLALGHLRKGVKLKDVFIAPDDFSVLRREGGNTWLEISIHSGKNRIIRRMMERLGYPVIKLIRTQMGPFSLEQLGTHSFLQLDSQTVQSYLQKITLPNISNNQQE